MRKALRGSPTSDSLAEEVRLKAHLAEWLNIQPSEVDAITMMEANGYAMCANDASERHTREIKAILKALGVKNLR